MDNLKRCLREPVPAIFDAARFLDAAVSAHLLGARRLAADLIRAADLPAVREWTESLWGKGGPWSRPLFVDQNLPPIARGDKASQRMPSIVEKRALIARDGYHCRFCSIPLIRLETRNLIKAAYPDALSWGSTNASQHAAFQALWLQFDHLLPHARGGTSAIDNMLVTCAPCNNGRSNLTLAEVGVADPRPCEPVRSTWDGLERFQVNPLAAHPKSVGPATDAVAEMDKAIEGDRAKKGGGER